MRSPGENRGGASAWQMRKISVSTTMTYEERAASAPDHAGAEAFGARSPDDQDRWLCERLRELYATGSFWHISAKLAADRIESLIAERDCALAAFELELDREAPGEAQAALVVDCEQESNGALVPTLAPSLEPRAAPVLQLPSPESITPAPPAPAQVERASEPDVTDAEIEAAARILCAHNGVDPDAPVLYREHKGVRVRSEPTDETAGRHSAMPVWKWRFEAQARAALEAAATARSTSLAAPSEPCRFEPESPAVDTAAAPAAPPSGG